MSEKDRTDRRNTRIDAVRRISANLKRSASEGMKLSDKRSVHHAKIDGIRAVRNQLDDSRETSKEAASAEVETTEKKLGEATTLLRAELDYQPEDTET